MATVDYYYYHTRGFVFANLITTNLELRQLLFKLFVFEFFTRSMS